MSAIASTTPVISEVDLDCLQRMTFKELYDLYLNSAAPASLSELDGDASGRMLAWRRPATGLLAGLLKKLGQSGSFPWEGKSFRSSGGFEGDGINRVKLFGKRRWFPFATRLGPSIIDGRSTFVLDYAARSNPPLIRSIVDEVREASPGLYFGPAALKVGGKPRLILFFAVSLR